MERTVEIVGVVDGRALIIGIVIGQQQVGMFADGLGIVQGGVDRIGMQRIVVVLVDGLVRIQFVKIVPGIIEPVAIIDVDSSGKVQGQGPVGLFEFMPDGKVGTVDIET